MFRLPKSLMPVLICIVLALSTAVSSAAPLLQLGSRGRLVREVQSYLITLKYLRSKADGCYGKATVEAVRSFQLEQQMPADGKVGTDTLDMLKSAVENQGKFFEYTVKAGESLTDISARFSTTPAEIMVRNDMESDAVVAGQVLIIPRENYRQATTRGIRNSTKEVPWSVMNKLWKTEGTVSVLDIQTGITFTAKRCGGYYHADAEPLTREDTEKLRKIYGGSWSWERRAIIVRYGNLNIAASMNGMPHGYKTVIGNGFPGQFCIHFLGSRIHKSGRVDDSHMERIEEAAQVDPLP